MLGKLGRHDVALAIYAHVLSDPKMADNYCKRMYDPDNEDDKDVGSCRKRRMGFLMEYSYG